MNNSIYNFSSGPATLPRDVLVRSCDGIDNFNNSGLSILELGFRDANFNEIAERSEMLFRELLHIPANYHILFLHGGARSQFSMVPMNLAVKKKKTAYFNTGIWSKFAIEESKKYSRVSIVADSSVDRYTGIPDKKLWKIDSDVDYVHYTDNETVDGIEFPYIPDVGNAPLVSDMSSNLLSRTFDITKYGLIYACAQKNLGPAGVTIVIIRNDLISEAQLLTPSMFRYQNHVEKRSRYNTPPVFSWYVVSLMLQWIKDSGGLTVFENSNQEKASIIYEVIDNSGFYLNLVNKEYRSRMNIPFKLALPKLTEKFISDAEHSGLFGLRGHPLAGGIRAALYNSMPKIGANVLADFMKTFERCYG